MKRSWAILVVAVLFLASKTSFASPVVWTLNNIAFSEQGPTDYLTGTFDYDADTQTVSNADLTFSYCCGQTAASVSVSGTTIDFHSFQPGDIVLAADLTDAGGTVDAVSGTYNALFSLDSGGTLTGVPAAPEPSSFALCLTGIGFMMECSRRRRARA